jgi:hypothetical protein
MGIMMQTETKLEICLRTALAIVLFIFGGIFFDVLKLLNGIHLFFERQSK